MKTREEMAEEFRKFIFGVPTHPVLLDEYERFEKSLCDLLARRDEMVIEECAKIMDQAIFQIGVLKYPADDFAQAIRALKNKLK